MKAPASATDSAPSPPVVPRATYRLQLHKDFAFDTARGVLPYLQRLGISHVYCSPITRARPGSLHGYDVVDHAQINPELGGMEGFLGFARAARALGMGLLLDQVPNHMGVFGADNAWWMDVLEHGPASEFAGHFDIDWQPQNPALADKLLVPVLGQAYGEVLDRGDIELGCDAASGTLALHYAEHRFPLDPRTYAAVLELAAALPGAAEQAARWQALARESRAIAPRKAQPAEAAVKRAAAGRRLQRRLGELLRTTAGAVAALNAALQAFNDASGRERLHALHEAQAYRLADWHMAADEINYRRFFDINELAALRVEEPRVFEAVQGLALDLAAQGWVDGLRIDHPDGLLDPATYLEWLQQGYARRRQDMGGGAKSLYVVVEKIIAAHEELPRGWAVQGTTGYRFSNLVNGLFVERRNEQRLERTWRAFCGEAPAYAELVHQCKRLVAHGTMAAQLTTLTHALQRIAMADRHTRDYGFNTLRDALAEIAAAMPVYRTYIVDQASAQDRQFIDWAVAQARRRGHATPPALFDFMRRCLLALPASKHDAEQAEHAGQVRAFAMAFQQFCAPLAAKGIEDTAFYRHHRLVSLNEVGGDPSSFGVSASAFHGASRDRLRHWPHTMLATSTHDNKRAEDVRCRIDVLSEEPAAWRLALRRWKLQTRSWRSMVDGTLAPSAADLYLLLQTLLGTLPAEGLDAAGLDGYRARIEAYMLKAAREAKQHTNWAFPHAGYEAALIAVVRGLLGRLDGNPVLADLQARAQRIAWFGALNSLAMTVLKFSSPGVPDIYQGCELLDFSVVDPDNRRPVDFERRDRLLAELEAQRVGLELQSELASLARTPEDGRAKLWLAWRLLAQRQAAPALFSQGRYVALPVRGARRRHVVAFARRAAGATLLVMVGRKFAGLGLPAGTLPLGEAVWADTHVRRPDWLAPPPLRGFDVLTEREVEIGPGPLPLGEHFVHFPATALWLQT